MAGPRTSSYLVLTVSLLLVALESLVWGVTYMLPDRLLQLCTHIVEEIYAATPFKDNQNHYKRTVENETAHRIAQAPDFVSMCQVFGYKAQEHIVKTQDGYLLGVHRIVGKLDSNKHDGARSEGSNDKTYSKHKHSSSKPVIYLHHGLLMNSEVWLAVEDGRKSLALALVDQGYDVWLGNNRGNKYSKKHLTLHSSQATFWNFSMDEFALFDIPDTIDYILAATQKSQVSFIGFSQGSAQAFAALSINPGLESKLAVFIALAPSMSPPRLRNKVVSSLASASPSLLFFFFGRKSILQSVVFWQSITFPPLFISAIDAALVTLFDWRSRNISYTQKIASYPHLYAYTSVKTVVHWFQIISRRKFQMYDDYYKPSMFFRNEAFYKVAPFPTENIQAPVVLIYGDADSLIDIDLMAESLPRHAVKHAVPNYEHLDMIWGRDVDQLIFPIVMRVLQKSTESPSSPQVSTRRSSGTVHRRVSQSSMESAVTAASLASSPEPFLSKARPTDSLSSKGFEMGAAKAVADVLK